MQPNDRSPSESYFWPIVWAVALHVLLFGLLFVGFSMTPNLPPSKPIIQATLYQAKSQSQATTQTNQKIAGEAEKTKARQYETEQLELRKAEQERQAKAKAAAQKAADEKAAEQAAAEQKAAEQKKADEARKAQEAAAEAKAQKEAEAKAAEQKRQADIAKKKAADEAAAKQKAAEDAKKRAEAEAAKKKAAAEEAKKRAAADAAKKKKAAEEAAARKAAEDRKAQALAELLSDDTERQQAQADTQGDQVAGSLDDLLRLRAAQNWTRPPSARSNMTVQVRVSMLPDGTITNVSVARSSGNGAFDSSAVAAVRNIGRLVEAQDLAPADFAPYRSFLMTFTPEDLSL